MGVVVLLCVCRGVGDDAHRTGVEEAVLQCWLAEVAVGQDSPVVAGAQGVGEVVEAVDDPTAAALEDDCRRVGLSESETFVAADRAGAGAGRCRGLDGFEEERARDVGVLAGSVGVTDGVEGSGQDGRAGGVEGDAVDADRVNGCWLARRGDRSRGLLRERLVLEANRKLAVEDPGEGMPSEQTADAEQDGDERGDDASAAHTQRP